jgi:hypothetical protein
MTDEKEEEKRRRIKNLFDELRDSDETPIKEILRHLRDKANETRFGGPIFGRGPAGPFYDPFGIHEDPGYKQFRDEMYGTWDSKTETSYTQEEPSLDVCLVCQTLIGAGHKDWCMFKAPEPQSEFDKRYEEYIMGDWDTPAGPTPGICENCGNSILQGHLFDCPKRSDNPRACPECGRVLSHSFTCSRGTESSSRGAGRSTRGQQLYEEQAQRMLIAGFHRDIETKLKPIFAPYDLNQVIVYKALVLMREYDYQYTTEFIGEARNMKLEVRWTRKGQPVEFSKFITELAVKWWTVKGQKR